MVTAAVPEKLRMRRLMAGLRESGRRVITPALVCLLAGFVLAAAAAAWLWNMSAARSRTIAALIDGQDAAVPVGGPSELLFARTYFLLTHARLDDAQPLANTLDARPDDRLRAPVHYNMANARLRLAFDKIEQGDFDAAGSLVGLAREDYREAIKLDPGDWNARFNFDVASRLVREYPSFGFTADERRRGPRPLWTELPNLPRGEP